METDDFLKRDFLLIDEIFRTASEKLETEMAQVTYRQGTIPYVKAWAANFGIALNNIGIECNKVAKEVESRINASIIGQELQEKLAGIFEGYIKKKVDEFVDENK